MPARADTGIGYSWREGGEAARGPRKGICVGIIPQAQRSGGQSFTHEGTRASSRRGAEPEQMSRSAWPRVKPDTAAQGSARARRRVGTRLRGLYAGGDPRKRPGMAQTTGS